jgi:hypothetical protein
MSSIRGERMRPIRGFIGGCLFEAGLITLEQLDAALERQLELIAQGRSMRLGEVLVQMGAVTREQLEQAQSRQWTEEEETRPAAEEDDRPHDGGET